MMKTYKVNGFGNYSYTFNWDSGVDLSEPVETDEVFIPTDIMFMGRYVFETFSNEHGGSRNVEMLVQADDKETATEYAKIYCSYYYPSYDEDEDEDED